ncbi:MULTISPECIES: acyl-CoA dehydrogenase family protein [Actinoplanes]|uniref:acyl-CoA dehydrogenase family protein n=1 Tax=Actinoplanes TaxID=1865 RepID=UPI0005F28A4F|nr:MULTISPECIES: acyl-CoA dehydrogenase family protein [Actinoplanes]GLY06458.1 acyl-CoA dehydrogenase [Actinoplanes sp. NBRC 101535]
MFNDEQDRLAPETVEALRKAGDFALGAPGTTARSILDRQIEIGRTDPSASWVAGVGVVSRVLARRLAGAAEQEELFADPDALFCGSGRPDRGTGVRDGDDVLITGAWPNVSGCEDATWAGLALMIDGVPHFANVAVADLTVDRTWRTAGMRATGSHTLVADGVRVPARFVTGFRPFSVDDVMLFALTVIGPVIGAARGALDVTHTMFASGRKPFMTAYASMGESAGARHWLAEATHLIERAERAAFAIAAAVDADGEVPSADLPRWHMDQAAVGRDCRAAVDLLLDLHGAGGFALDNPVQRFWRDVAVASRHPHLNPYLAVEKYGTALV